VTGVAERMVVVGGFAISLALSAPPGPLRPSVTECS
jgi:hypothetical protein